MSVDFVAAASALAILLRSPSFAGLAASLKRSWMPSEAQAKEGGRSSYVYLIESSTGGQRYVGLTTDLKRRFEEHNAGKSAHTSKYRPWRLMTYLAFSDRAKAEDFERYLKSGSGHAFAAKRLW